MLIAVVSDSHGDKNAIKKAIKKIGNADYLFHLGDNVKDIEEFSKQFSGRIVNVKGNCDFICNEVGERVVVIGKNKFFLTHGHKYSVKEGLLRLKYKAKEVGANIVLFGHTHVPCIEYNDKDRIWFINPGSISLSRFGNNTLILIDIFDDRIIPSIVEVD